MVPDMISSRKWRKTLCGLKFFFCKMLDGGFTKVASLQKSVRKCFHLVESAWLSSFLLSRGRFESSTPEIVSEIFVVSFERKGMRVLSHPLNSKEKTADRDSIICSMAPWNITIILEALWLYFSVRVQRGRVSQPRNFAPPCHSSPSGPVFSKLG